MTIPPDQLSLHMRPIETAQGTWLIIVNNVMEAQSGGTILLKLFLEQTFDEGERFRARNLAMAVFASELRDPNLFESVLSQIRRWIETTEGDGFLDLTNP